MNSNGWNEFSKLQDKFTKLFKDKWGISLNLVKTKNIIDCNRDLVFVWNPKENNILVINVTLLAGTTSKKCYQTLELSAGPDCAVDRLLLNDTCTHVLLAGTRGACVVALPGRWGSSGLFADGRDSVPCKSLSVDASFFLRSLALEIREVRWCPAPLSDQLIVLLISNNTLRLYRAAAPDTSLQEWRVGRPLGAGSLMNPGLSQLPLLAALGRTAVAFDFMPPMSSTALGVPTTPARLGAGQPSRTSTPMPAAFLQLDGDTERDSSDILWPIAVLFGDGDVYIVIPPHFNPNMPTCERSRLFGPLRMLPASRDNYGAESCALLCLQVQPPVLVLASSSGGALYHTVLLSKLEDADSDNHSLFSWVDEVGDSDMMGSECTKVLYVVEKVQLELGMQLEEEKEESVSPYACPIHLHKDPTSPARYFCSTDTGIHVISLPLVSKLIKFSKGLGSIESVLGSVPCEGVSSEEQYLLCTQLAHSNTPSEPPQGLVLLPSLSLGLTLLPSARAALLPLPLLTQPTLPALTLQEQPKTENKTTERVYFVDHIRLLLARSNSQPLLMLPPGAKPSNRECLELLNKCTQTLRSEFLAKHATVSEEFKRKVTVQRKTLQIRKQQVDDLDMSIIQLTSALTVTFNKLLATKESMMKTLKRLQSLHLNLCLAEPETSLSELKMRDKLSEVKQKVDPMQAKINILKSSMAQIKTQLSNKQEEGGETIHLTLEEEDTVKEALKEMTLKIGAVKKQLVNLQSAIKSHHSAFAVESSR